MRKCGNWLCIGWIVLRKQRDALLWISLATLWKIEMDTFLERREKLRKERGERETTSLSKTDDRVNTKSARRNSPRMPLSPSLHYSPSRVPSLQTLASGSSKQRFLLSEKAERAYPQSCLLNPSYPGPERFEPTQTDWTPQIWSFYI